MTTAIMWLATILNLSACALNMYQYLRGKRLNKEVEDALYVHKRAADRMPKIHIVHLIHEQPEVKVVDMKKRAKVDDSEIKEEEKEA